MRREPDLTTAGSDDRSDNRTHIRTDIRTDSHTDIGTADFSPLTPSARARIVRSLCADCEATLQHSPRDSRRILPR